MSMGIYVLCECLALISLQMPQCRENVVLPIYSQALVYVVKMCMATILFLVHSCVIAYDDSIECDCEITEIVCLEYNINCIDSG